jgi:ATP adenylyltransferase/5',5'''-P-1,P-4-tetraphosphate phosphorylase II
MLLATRSKSDYTFSDGTTLSLNALGFAGMILTKNREQFNRITDELDIRQILLEVGFPRAELDKGIMDEVEEAA